ncbi:hypothetical protein E5Q_03454 [Mixia osmundae IAM 14324]|uniref:Uncharacterized protein n=1 Tax=Mixia osmundae (strain CBS 9802 / IAM 14324 / JCM 22182 / KY 12970) TaxID=764103 RepID=G7E1S3_MIXOS|nr:hypothetical protein E5Q_03454 [Mixia osmundae IAM 14324]
MSRAEQSRKTVTNLFREDESSVGVARSQRRTRPLSIRASRSRVVCSKAQGS